MAQSAVAEGAGSCIIMTALWVGWVVSRESSVESSLQPRHVGCTGMPKSIYSSGALSWKPDLCANPGVASRNTLCLWTFISSVY